MAEFHEALTDAPVVVRAENISKHFTLRRDNSLKDRLLAFRTGNRHREEFTALDNVSVEVRAGHTVALIGHNGSGKSTLLKIIGGILDPSSGMISRRGRLAALLELGAGFHPDLSGRDNVFLNASLLGMSRAETEAVFDDIVAFAEIEEFIDTQVKFYSSGMYVRLAFAVAVHTDPEVLLVDEVLAVGDEAFQRKCMDTIRRFQAEGRTIILVTHSLEQVIELADSAVLLHHGKLVYAGEPREAVSQFRDLLEEHRVATAISHGGDGIPAVTASASVERQQSERPVEPGDDLQIVVEIEGRIEQAGWVCAMQIDTERGHTVFGTNNSLVNLELSPLLDEKRTITFNLTDTHFGEGKLFVSFAIISSIGEHIIDKPQATMFEAQTPEHSRGAVYTMVTIDAA